LLSGVRNYLQIFTNYSVESLENFSTNYNFNSATKSLVNDGWTPKQNVLQRRFPFVSKYASTLLLPLLMFIFSYMHYT